MRVLMVHNKYLQPGGEDSAVEATVRLLQHHGHDVELLTFKNPSDKRQQAIALARSAWNSNAARHATGVARRFHPDVVHTHNTWFQATLAVPHALYQNYPVVGSLHNYRVACVNATLFREGSFCQDCVGNLPWRGISRRCYNNSVVASSASAIQISASRIRHQWQRSYERLFVLSDYAAQIAVASGIPDDKLFKIDNSVQDVGPRPLPPSESNKVLFVGRLSEEKGIKELIHTWTMQAPNGLELVVVGDGPLMGTLKTTSGAAVTFTGRLPTDQVRRLMLESRALVMPSLCAEGQPIVLLEALAAGLPVLASDRPPIAEALAESGQQIVADGDWGAAFGRITSSDWADRASSQARQHYLSRFTEQTNYDALMGHYAAAIESHHSGRASGRPRR